MFVQINVTCPENNNLQELALCSDESHFDGRRVILLSRFKARWQKTRTTEKAAFLLERRGFLQQPQRGLRVCSPFTLLPVGVYMVEVPSSGDYM